MLALKGGAVYACYGLCQTSRQHPQVRSSYMGASTASSQDRRTIHRKLSIQGACRYVVCTHNASEPL